MGDDTDLKRQICISPHALPTSGVCNVIIKIKMAERGLLDVMNNIMRM